MRFFVPVATDQVEAERVYQGIRIFVSAEGFGPLSEKRIARIQFSHDGNRFNLSVGETHPQLNEMVIAILESDRVYLICTPNRGVARGTPYLVGKGYHTHIEEFESASIAGA